jgi:hypothetical protein
MATLIGIILALSVCGLATIVGFDRERAFYPVVTIVIASYYGLFAVMGGSRHVLALELIFVAAFILISILGFKENLWIVVVALAAHGVFDLIHGRVIADPGVPAWWPAACLSYDVVTAMYLAALLVSQRLKAQQQP